MTNLALRIVMVSLVLLKSASALAQSESKRFELGAELAVIKSSEFDAKDVGFGARFSWAPFGLLGLESEINFYPKGFPGSVSVQPRPRGGALRRDGRARGWVLSDLLPKDAWAF